jgi:hypothetical protein
VPKRRDARGARIRASIRFITAWTDPPRRPRFVRGRSLPDRPRHKGGGSTSGGGCRPGGRVTRVMPLGVVTVRVPSGTMA